MSAGGSAFDRPLSEVLGRPSVARAALLLLSIPLLFGEAADAPLSANDTAIHGGIARRMAETGRWLTPELYGEPWFEHLPLFLWLTAASFRVFGFGPGAARLPGLLLALITVLAVFEIGRLKKDALAGLAAGVALVTTEIFWRYSGRVRMDVPVTCFITLAILSLELARARSPRFGIGFGVALGLTIFTKGPLGLVPIAAWIAAALFGPKSERPALIKNPWIWAGLVFALAIPAPWIVYQLEAGRGWYERYVLHQMIALPSGVENTRWDPLFVPRTLLASYWPWLPLLVLSVVRAGRRWRDNDDGASIAVFAGWAGFVVLGLTLSRRQPDYYLLPAYPAFASMIGWGAASWLDKPHHRAGVVAAVAAAGVLLAVLLSTTRINPRESSLERMSGQFAALAPAVEHELAEPGTALGVFGLHQDRSEWSLSLYLDVARPPARLEDDAALDRFLSEPGAKRVVVLPTDELPRVLRTLTTTTATVAEAAGLTLLRSPR